MISRKCSQTVSANNYDKYSRPASFTISFFSNKFVLEALLPEMTFLSFPQKSDYVLVIMPSRGHRNYNGSKGVRILSKSEEGEGELDE